MGLTIHYSFEFPKDPVLARGLLEAMREKAQDLPFEEVRPIKTFKGEETNYEYWLGKDEATLWFLIQSQNSVYFEDTQTVVDVPNKEVTGFTIIVAPGSEPMNIGFLVPKSKTVANPRNRTQRKSVTTTWCSFTKTQYANNPTYGGGKNFLRAHLSVVAMLDYAKSLDILKSVSDEGYFWENRNVEELASCVGAWDSMIAAFVGTVTAVAADSNMAVAAPIAAYPNVERLEADGLAEFLKKSFHFKPKR